ncbi:MAG: sigma-54 dependent transcriptional regulator [Ideonella sp.]
MRTTPLPSTQATAAATAPAPTHDWPHASLLVVDDEPGMRNFLDKALAPRCAEVHCAGSAEEADQLARLHRFDLVILDITLPGKTGIAWLRELRDQGYAGEVILMTAFADLNTAIEALRAGASDFILKPFRLTQILNAVERGLERAQLKRENWVLRRSLSHLNAPAETLIGSSDTIDALRNALARTAAVASTVLLAGESGTGKELAALALHRLSARADGPFVPVNCASISPELVEREFFGAASQGPAGGQSRDGLFLYARGGTLFLDEIAELPLALQANLLRVLDDRKIRPVGSEQQIPVDVRIVAATNRILADEVAAGRFRKDLYYRLQVVEITLPPLRTHKEDIDELVRHFIALLAPQLGVAPLAVSEQDIAYLCQYDWPGNVRELRNLIERSLILGALNVSALYQRFETPSTQPAFPGPVDLHALEKQHILAVLESVRGDKTEAAQRLGISRRTLERRLADWGA